MSAECRMEAYVTMQPAPMNAQLSTTNALVVDGYIVAVYVLPAR